MKNYSIITTLMAIVFAFAPTNPLWSAEKKRPQEEIRLVTDPETNDLLEEMGRPLLEAADLPNNLIRFHVILSNDLNAFALPNQHIVFHSALIMAAENRDEVAGVMAHEIGHIAAGHHSQMKDAAKGISIRSLITSAAGVAAGIATGNSKLTQAGLAGGAASGQASMLSLMRQKETQSDRLAVHYLARAGFDPMGMASFLSLMGRQQRIANVPPSYLLTHPLSEQRLMESRDQAATVQKRSDDHAEISNARLRRVQAKLAAGSAMEPAKEAERFRAKLANNPKDIPARYGLALAVEYSGEMDEAEQILDQLLKELGNDIYILRERGLVRMDQGRLKEAENDFRAALQQKPESADFQYRLAAVLEEQGELDEASRVLYRLTSAHSDHTQALYLLGMVEGKRGAIGKSHLTLARFYRLDRDYDTARWHYEEAARTLPEESTEHKIATSELKQMQEKLKKKSYFTLGK